METMGLWAVIILLIVLLIVFLALGFWGTIAIAFAIGLGYGLAFLGIRWITGKFSNG